MYLVKDCFGIASRLVIMSVSSAGHVADRRYNMEHKQPWYLKKLGLTVKLTKFWNMLDDLVWSGDWQRKMNDDPEGLKKVSHGGDGYCTGAV